MSHTTLGVNVDHVATIRQARRGIEPDPCTAASIAELAGARCITIHLREDRRHIIDRDVEVMRAVVKTKLNLEMAATEEMFGIAIQHRPHQVCLVPEKREELTTEGGLNILEPSETLKRIIVDLRETGMAVSLFVDPVAENMQHAADLGASIVELHTGEYAHATDAEEVKHQLDRIHSAAKAAAKAGLEVHAGHGLDYRNVTPVSEIPEITELNIGHSIVSRAIFVGFDRAVQEMLAAMQGRVLPK